MLFTGIDQRFFDEFRIHIAKTPNQKNEVYKVRYKVYCEELQYESVHAFPNKMEKDSYDKQSIHLLVQHRESSKNIGCMRLIFPENSEQVLPFQKAYGTTLINNIVDLKCIYYNSMCEVSRLAVVSEFRKSHRKQSNPISNVENIFDAKQYDRRHFSLVPLSLYLAGCHILEVVGVNHLFTMMEPRLCRNLQRVGYKFHQIGHIINYHGKRAPYYITLNELVKNLDPVFSSLRDKINEEINPDIRTYLSGVVTQKAAY
jgi:N-acyl amino acid synthase of PEP-CTERM/exosortase system